MDIPPTWAVALAGAGLMSVLVLVAMQYDDDPTWIARLAYLLGGGVAGFLAIAFPPAWPPLAFIGTMLVGMALRDGRLCDVSLLAVGFGSTWTYMLGSAILEDLADPAVSGGPETFPWFMGGTTLLVAGLTALVGETLADRA